MGPDSSFITSQVWMNDLEDDIQTNGVEIMELNSSQNSKTSSEEHSENLEYVKHPWSYAGLLNAEENYKANVQARLKRRLRNRNGWPDNGVLDNETDDSLYLTRTPDTADMEAFNQTCFSILDKLSALKLDNSLDDLDGNEARGAIVLEEGWNGKGDNGEEIVTYSSELDSEKHTIWIYSFKNKRYLSDFDFESVNIPSRDSVSTNSPSEINEELNTSKSTRVSSPIPAAHIPRLDLSLGATLPNVTEVTEPKSSESLNPRKHVPVAQKLANNWCFDTSEQRTTGNKVASIVNWMALSPRERRRHSLSDAPIPRQSMIEDFKDKEKAQNQEPVREQFEIETKPVVLKADVTTMENEMETANESKFSPSRINSQRSSSNSRRRQFGNNATYLVSPFSPRHRVAPDLPSKEENKSSKTSSQVNSERSSTNSRREKFGDNATYLVSPFARHESLNVPYKAGNQSELSKLRNAIKGAFSDRGNYKVQRPHITIGKPLHLSPISRPIENLDSDDWIAEPKSSLQNKRSMSAGDRLMIRNFALLKPAEWKSYSPITGSRLSLQLELPELEPQKTLLQKCVSCFKCWK